MILGRECFWSFCFLISSLYLPVIALKKKKVMHSSFLISPICHTYTEEGHHWFSTEVLLTLWCDSSSSSQNVLYALRVIWHRWLCSLNACGCPQSLWQSKTSSAYFQVSSREQTTPSWKAKPQREKNYSFFKCIVYYPIHLWIMISRLFTSYSRSFLQFNIFFW